MEASLNGPLGRTALGQGTVKIGRAPNNTLVINDPQSSAHHAEIIPGFDGNSYQVTDLNSTNGTFVNEQRLTPNVPRPLNPGDVIRIGALTFAYEAGNGYAPTVLASSNPFNNDQTVPSQAPVAHAPAYQQPAFNNYNVPPQSANTPPPPAYPSAPAAQPPSYPQPNNFNQQGYPQPQPSGFNQPGYPQSQPGGFSQPGYPPAPGFNQPGYPPAKKSRVGLWIGLIILLVVIIGGIGGFVYLQNCSTPEKTLQAYCTALQNNDAQGIYNTLSSASQAKTSVSQLSKGLQFVKLLTGGFTCTYANVQQSGSTATATLTLTPVTRGKASSGTAHLINENGQWKMDETGNVPTS